MRRRRVPWQLVAAAAFLIACLAATGDVGKRLEYELADVGAKLLLHEVDSDVVIIEIDARSLAELREWPWPRRYHAQLIEKLAPAAPRRLFLDIDFSSRSNPQDDSLLEAALSNWNGMPVILPAFYQYASSSGRELRVTQPLPRLRRHASLASVNLKPSVDGLVRRMESSWTGDGVTLPAAATLLNDWPRNSASIRQWIDFTIHPNSFQFISYSDVLADRIPAEYFAEKTVFVGATAIELGDMVAVPLHRALPGVVVQALAYESVRDGLHETLPASLYWLLLAVSTTLLSFLFCRQSWQQNIVIAVGSLTLVAIASLYAYAAQATVVPVVPAALAVTVAYLLSTLRALHSETLRALSYALSVRKRDALLKSIVSSSSDSIVCISADGVIKSANSAAARLFSCRRADLQGTSIFAFVPSLGCDAADAWKFEAMAGSVAECTAQTSAGENFPVELSISRVKSNEEHLYTAIVRDISERKAQTQLQFQATHDPLTTLPNRPALAAHLDSLLARLDATQPVALMMIDLDRFKEVNDTLGHDVGDYVLYEVARRFKEIIGERGFIARIGGDEFALVVDGFAELSEISQLSQELIDSLKVPIETSGVAIDVGLSVGIALHPQHARDAETLFKQSDVAMYVAKRSGSGFEYYDSANDRHSVRKLSVLSCLRKAIADDRLQLHYQPQVNLATGRVESVEALLRWEDTPLGVVSPEEFVALAETPDLVQPLCRWTLVRAFEQSVRWRADGLKLRIAINLSARILQDALFPAKLAALMSECGVAAEDIELEIAESSMMLDPQRALRVVEKLREVGVMISIDDYGTGYSSLAYLRDLPVHALKLDKSFVMNMQQHDNDRGIVASMVQMAHALNFKAVADGVKCAAGAAILRDCGYDCAQGYWYSAARPPDELFAWVRKFNSASLHEQSTGTRRAGAAFSSGAL